jgi:hypothetical protein
MNGLHAPHRDDILAGDFPFSGSGVAGVEIVSLMGLTSNSRNIRPTAS